MLFMKYVNPGFHFLRIFSPTGQNIKILHSLNLRLAPRVSLCGTLPLFICMTSWNGTLLSTGTDLYTFTSGLL